MDKNSPFMTKELDELINSINIFIEATNKFIEKHKDDAQVGFEDDIKDIIDRRNDIETKCRAYLHISSSE